MPLRRRNRRQTLPGRPADGRARIRTPRRKNYEQRRQKGQER
jgi:hypothetical protein